MLTTILNTTLLLLLLLLTHMAVFWIRHRFRQMRAEACAASAFRMISSPWLILCLVAGTLLGVGSRLYICYVAPADILQDTLSAREFLNGASLYPHNMHAQDILTHDPPEVPLGDRIPYLRSLQRDQFAGGAATILNGHPPIWAISLVPLVKVLGPYRPALIVNLVSLSLLGLGIRMLNRGLDYNLSPCILFASTLAIFGWQPVLAGLRHANVSLMIGCLVLFSWWHLRRELPAKAGVVIGIAASLKLYPGIIMVYLLWRHRRAGIICILTGALLAAAVISIAGWQAFVEFASVPGEIIRAYGGARNNFSLLSLISSGISRQPGEISAVVFGVYLLLSSLIISYVLMLLWRTPSPALGYAKRVDFEFSLFACLACLLSPIAWSHYYTILLVPLGVVAKYGLRTISSSAQLVLLTIGLSLPDQPIRWLSCALEHELGQRAGRCLASIPTLAMAVLLIRLIWLYNEFRTGELGS